MFGKSAVVGALLLSTAVDKPGHTAHRVSETTLSSIQAWFAELDRVKPDETFGELAVRAARLRLGTPYDDTPQSAGPETLEVRVDKLHCVSLVEYADALARCLWRESPTSSCFLGEVEQTRYRNGEMSNYASRLHYFVDWLGDNQKRERLRRLDRELTAVSIREPFFFMTRHPHSYPALADQDTRAAIVAAEKRLSHAEHMYVPRERIS
ncbi:MAG: N-acetylmuramoyl-L-alanine amidase-like domain-containing protein, partial [Myxococcota bacterium]